jgi:hypothetical protein
VLATVTQQITDDPVNFYYLGVAYQKLNQNDKAIEAYSGRSSSTQRTRTRSTR